MVDRDNSEEKWQKFVSAAFTAANLPDVPEDQLEVGTYTNAQIAEKFKDDPLKFVGILMKLSEMSGNDAEKRSILSFTADIYESQKAEDQGL